MKEKLICSVCGKELTKETSNEFDGRILCKECFEGGTVCCDSCGVRIWNDDTCGDEYTSLCQRCYDNHYTTCEECGAVIHNDNAYYDEDDDYSYCHECYHKLFKNSIKSYNYKPEPIFYGSGSLYFGVEIEIDKGGEDNNNAKVLLDIANKNGEKLYAKHDGSIEDGFELVSHPMTLDYHENEMNWKEIFGKAVELGYRSHQTSTCGFHVHINRSFFGDTHEAQEDAISRVVYFVEKHWNELLKFSRRTEDAVMRWASRYGIHTTAKDTYKNAKDKYAGRYVAVNLENYNTIEIRIFRGTLNIKTFIATLQLIEEICTKSVYFDDKFFEKMSWSEFVKGIDKEKKPEIIEYLKMKQLYINEAVASEEEM